MEATGNRTGCSVVVEASSTEDTAVASAFRSHPCTSAAGSNEPGVHPVEGSIEVVASCTWGAVLHTFASNHADSHRQPGILVASWAAGTVVSLQNFRTQKFCLRYYFWKNFANFSSYNYNLSIIISQTG